MLTLITFLIVLSVLVIAHEFGHFWTARKFGVKAEEFGLGFPPRVFGIYKDEEGKWKKVIGGKKIQAPGTIYSLNWFPLGGFVKIKGEDGEGENEPDSFINRKIWKRATIISAGVTMNIVLAAVLIIIGLSFGLPQSIEGDMDPRAKISERKIQVVEVVPDSPAFKAGLEVRDSIVSINGTEFKNSDELSVFVDKHTGEELIYKIKRNSDEFEKKITPSFMEETKTGGIGIGIVETGIVKYPFLLSIWEGIKATFIMTWLIIVAFYELFKGLIMGHGVSTDVAGPVGIATITGQFARMGFIYVLQFTALLSINLAIINFLPFPALDGGRVLFLFIEKIKGTPVKREIEAVIHNIGFALLMVLVIIVTFRDILKIWQ